MRIRSQLRRGHDKIHDRRACVVSRGVYNAQTTGRIAACSPLRRRKARIVIEYRTFRNTDPPLVAEAWVTCLAGPRTVSIPVKSTTLLEYFVFAKLYFDPAGLCLAIDREKHQLVDMTEDGGNQNQQ